MAKVIENQTKEFKVAPQWIEQYSYVRKDGKEITVKGHLVHKDEYQRTHTCHFSDYFNQVNNEGKHCSAGSLFPYVGGKEQFYKWNQTILREKIDFSDGQVQTVAIPFGGAMNDALNVFPFLLENNYFPKIVINDINETIIHFYTIIRDDKEALIVEIQSLIARKKELYGDNPTLVEHKEFQKWMRSELNTLEKNRVFNVSRAALFHLVMLATFNGNLNWTKGRTSIGITGDIDKFHYLNTAIERIEMVSYYFGKFEIVLETMDYKELFKKYDSRETLWLLDSPYLKLKSNEFISTAVKYGNNDFPHRQYNEDVMNLQGQMIYHNYLNYALVELFSNNPEFQHIEYKKSINNGKPKKGKKQPKCVEVIYFTTRKKKVSKRKPKPSVQQKTVVQPVVQVPVLPSIVSVVPMVAVTPSMVMNNNTQFRQSKGDIPLVKSVS